MTGMTQELNGVMIFIDDAYVSSVDEVEEAMKGRKRDTDVTIAFTQAKTSELWSKAEINVLKSRLAKFLDHAAYPHSVYMTNAREAFDAVKHVARIGDGKRGSSLFRYNRQIFGR